MNQIVSQKVADIIQNTVNSLGFDLVRVRLQGVNFQVLEVLIDRLDNQKVSVADCRNVSYNISALLDVEDVIKGKYYLEVASAGAERPLIKLEDYQKFAGQEIKLRLKKLLDGCGHYQGKISKVEGNKIYLNVKNQDIAIDFDLIKNAHLVLTDEIFRKLLNK